MTHSYEEGVLTLSNDEGGTVVLMYNPETQVAFSSEEEALAYAFSKPLYFSTPLSAQEVMAHELVTVESMARKLLADTDWVEAKFVREVLRDKTTTQEEFNAKYADVLSSRQRAIEDIRACEKAVEEKY